MPISPLAGQPAESAALIDPARLIARLLRDSSRSRRRRAARVVRNLGPSRQRVRRLVQRAAHSGDHAGDLRLSRAGANRRTAVSGNRHAHFIRARVCERARSAGGERRGDCGSRCRGRGRPVWWTWTTRRRRRFRMRLSITIAAGQAALADGIVITPSHNPPEDGGFKYNPPHGGPADSGITKFIQDLANTLLEGKLAGVKRIPFGCRDEGRHHAAPRFHR